MTQLFTNYKQLKLGKYDMPTWDGLLPVVIAVSQSKKEWKSRELINEVVTKLHLPERLRHLKYEKYPNSDPVIHNRISWALSEGTIAGLLTRPRRGIYQVTDLGKQLLEQHGLHLDYQVIHAQKSYILHKEELKRKKALSDEIVSITPATEEEGRFSKTEVLHRIGTQIENYNAQISVNLLERIREAEPEFFEHLVVDLLAKMGYQGINGSSIVTPTSGDGGIDGVINQDPLGTSTVYIQAKRYQAKHPVQRPEIDGFYGALSRKHADRGVFITTSSFTDGAVKTADDFSIILIDGLRLTDLMLQYQVGVQVKYHYDLFTVDEDYFESDSWD